MIPFFVMIFDNATRIGHGRGRGRGGCKCAPQLDALWKGGEQDDIGEREGWRQGWEEPECGGDGFAR